MLWWCGKLDGSVYAQAVLLREALEGRAVLQSAAYLAYCLPCIIILAMRLGARPGKAPVVQEHVWLGVVVRRVAWHCHAELV